MKKLLAIAGLASVIGAPAEAANFQGAGADVRTGAFVGARFRLPLNSGPAVRPRAELTLAMTQSYQSPGGRNVTRFGEGVALDFAGRTPTLNLAGMPADVALGLRRQGSQESQQKLGLSTVGWVVIGAVVVGGAVLAITQLTCIGKDKDYCGSD